MRIGSLTDQQVEVGVGLDQPDDDESHLGQLYRQLQRPLLRLVGQQGAYSGGQPGLEAPVGTGEQAHRQLALLSVIITNVTGPRHPMSLAGTPVTDLLFWVPTSGPVGVGLSLVSYAGKIILGIMVDSHLVPDAERLRALLDEELQELGVQASSREPAPRAH